MAKGQSSRITHEELIKKVASETAKNRSYSNMKPSGDITKIKGAMSDSDRFQRLCFIADKLRNGESFQSVRQLIMDTYQVSRITANKWISWATDIIKEDTSVLYTGIKDVVISRLDSIYRDAVETKDKRNALQALKQMTEITGIAEPTKTDMNLNSDIRIDFGENKTEEVKGEAKGDEH